jgi:hypothetical protein
MKNAELHFSTDSIKTWVGSIGKKFGIYKVFLFFLVIASLYGYILWRINAYSNAPPSESEVSAKTVAQPHIDQATVKKIQSLQDNSVSVQSLFDSARQNPFQE